MALDYRFDCEGGLLLVVTRGFDDSLEEAIAYGNDVIDACLECGCDRVLVDEREMTGTLEQVYQYEMARELAQRVPTKLRVALVTAPEFFRETAFGVLVAENRGVRVRVFTTPAEAREWLGE